MFFFLENYFVLTIAHIYGMHCGHIHMPIAFSYSSHILADHILLTDIHFLLLLYFILFYLSCAGNRTSWVLLGVIPMLYPVQHFIESPITLQILTSLKSSCLGSYDARDP